MPFQLENPQEAHTVTEYEIKRLILDLDEARAIVHVSNGQDIRKFALPLTDANGLRYSPQLYTDTKTELWRLVLEDYGDELGAGVVV